MVRIVSKPSTKSTQTMSKKTLHTLYSTKYTLDQPAHQKQKVRPRNHENPKRTMTHLSIQHHNTL